MTEIAGVLFLWNILLYVKALSVPCTPYAFRCLSGKCIPRSGYCNWKGDCSDNADEAYCNLDPLESCPTGWSLCERSDQCFPSHWLCDGRKDCRDGSDEANCAIKDLKDPRFVAGKERLISWFKQRRKSGSAVDKWGVQLHRVAVALYLADESIFSPDNSTGQEISYELTIQLLRRFSKDKKMSSQELALYIHAMMVACMDPRDFYGDNLVLELRKRTECSGNYTNPFQILVLCNAGDTMTSWDVDRVTAAYNSQHRPFWTDTQALASLALACLSSRPNLVTDERILKAMLHELKRRQFRNGTVDNVKTTALVVQALLIHDSFKKDFDIELALRSILESVKNNISLLNAYYALPVLSNTSLLNVSSSHCRRAPETEAEALAKALDVNEEAVSVQYSVWMGDKIELARTWRIQMRQNSSVYDVIETVSRIDSRQKAEYSVVEGKPFVTSLGGLEDDPETGTFWFVHLRALKSDGQPELMKQTFFTLNLSSKATICVKAKKSSQRTVPQGMGHEMTEGKLRASGFFK
ncbi:gastric intrinsic factor [Nephila pilipes]|uniref:Gastric intrinsic factor n=1 Tax=Nephila pilipes TaxID=299642 RepID=A0A8X6MJP3_NEPPI|nr:gastric intrinsic factor [Nephila pilipes]